MQKIVVASTLKPVDDVRLFEKIAQSMAKTNKYEINIIGNSGKKESTHLHINFHPVPIRRNKLLERWKTRWKVLQKIAAIRPHLIIVSTHELLFVIALCKLIFQVKTVYDVQENYYRNWRYRSAGFSLINLGIGIAIRSKEVLLHPLFDHFLLAEKTYAKELSFVDSNRKTVIENKATKIDFNPSDRIPNRFVFSGTISEYAEVELAVKLYLEISKKLTNPSLQIIGQIHDPKLRSRLELHARSNSGVQLLLSEDPISHKEILKAIHEAQFGLVSYQANPINREKTPTKVFEYSRYGLVYFVQHGTTWEERFREMKNQIVTDFKHPDLDKITGKIEQSKLNFEEDYPEEETWEYEAKSLNNIIDQLI